MGRGRACGVVACRYYWGFAESEVRAFFAQLFDLVERIER